ncbi:MAG: TolC family protein [Acidocella sp.]|nr:TolC family protein [Acidocella sp.]
MKHGQALTVICAGIMAVSLSGCAAYHSAPLNLYSPLKTSLSRLNRGPVGGKFIPVTGRLSAPDLAALAVLNDPDLVAARAQHGVAKAELLSAGLLPDPTLTGGFAALLSGPGSAPAISGSLTEDVAALITYSVNKSAAQAGLAQVDASILWQEWQVASQAEQLVVSLAADRRIVSTLEQDRAALAAVNAETSHLVTSGNLTIAASSASLAALAGTDTALNSAIQTQQRDANQLDALLGLQPGVAVSVILPEIPPIGQAEADQALATLAMRRPDLIALRYGYRQADARLRAAILTQFLPVSLGVAGGSDTSKVVSVGPQVTLNLPIFNRNRGVIATAQATRAVLKAQFSASLAAASGGAQSLLATIALLQSQSKAADRAAAQATGIAAQAQTAFAEGTLDALSAVNLQTAAADRTREAITLRAELLNARLSLATLLAIGLPPVAASDLKASS